MIPKYILFFYIIFLLVKLCQFFYLQRTIFNNKPIFNQPTAFATQCASQIVLGPSLPIELGIDNGLDDTFKSYPMPLSTILSVTCVKNTTIRITNAQFGLKSKEICPLPGSLVIFVDDSFCNEINKFRLGLVNKCKFEPESTTEFRTRYIDLNTREMCSINSSYPIFLPNNFCDLESFYLKNKFSTLNQNECIKNEFESLFSFCKKMPPKKSSVFVWTERRLSRIVASNKCSGKFDCKLNLNRDFPLSFTYENYQNEYLRIDFECKLSKYYYNPTKDKLFRMRGAVTANRNNRPFRGRLSFFNRKKIS